jgi:hypothetical protein
MVTINARMTGGKLEKVRSLAKWIELHPELKNLALAALGGLRSGSIAKEGT